MAGLSSSKPERDVWQTLRTDLLVLTIPRIILYMLGWMILTAITWSFSHIAGVIVGLALLALTIGLDRYRRANAAIVEKGRRPGLVLSLIDVVCLWIPLTAGLLRGLGSFATSMDFYYLRMYHDTQIRKILTATALVIGIVGTLLFLIPLAKYRNEDRESLLTYRQRRLGSSPNGHMLMGMHARNEFHDGPSRRPKRQMTTAAFVLAILIMITCYVPFTVMAHDPLVPVLIVVSASVILFIVLWHRTDPQNRHLDTDRKLKKALWLMWGWVLLAEPLSIAAFAGAAPIDKRNPLLPWLGLILLVISIMPVVIGLVGTKILKKIREKNRKI